MDIAPSTEIRNLPPSVKVKLGHILELEKSWKDIMAIVPKDSCLHSPKKYTDEHIRIVECASQATGKSGGEILIEEWGTSGRSRPTVQLLIDVLCEAKLFRAANYLSADVLQGKQIHPQDEFLEDSFKERLGCSSQLDDGNREEAPSEDSERMTDNFDERCFYSEGGRKLGRGGFGIVFLGILDDGTKVAVKRIACQELAQQQFSSEIVVWAQYRHENLLPVLGYLDARDALFLVYSFMSGSSLEDRLSCKQGTLPLPWQLRLQIAVGAARAVAYLHTHKAKPFIHRDLKSANILLDESFVPKVGDCGLARQGCRGSGTSVAMTTTILGTSAYMAPEAFKGDVSTKLDTYSYGVVLLELLTALPSMDEKREMGFDLISYMENVSGYQNVEPHLDRKAGAWNLLAAQQVADVAYRCSLTKRERPLMTEVLLELEELVSEVTDR